jgi:predicted HAD superfamily Cof-like phosphohydrolase
VSNLEKVKEFMQGVGQDVNTIPTQVSKEAAILRVKLLVEEVLELAEASGVTITLNGQVVADKDLEYAQEGDQDLVEVADALADIEYVMHGASLTYGLPAQEVFDEVHRNNMLKIERGSFNKDGKFIKPQNHPKVDLSFILSQRL